MGREMAGRLVAAGHELTVWNRTVGASSLFEGRARIAGSAREACDAEIVVTMLADDAAVEEVWIKPRLETRGVHLNMATVSMRMARELARLQDDYVSAPVFGRPPAATKGELDVIAAGPAGALERCAPLFKALARQVFVVGAAPEQANAVKIARNFLLATVIEGLGEALALARRTGVDPARFVEIITSTSLAAPAYRNYGKLMVERAFEPAQFSIELGLKDLDLALDTALEAGLSLPTGKLVRDNLERAIARGDGHKDWVAAADYIAENEPTKSG